MILNLSARKFSGLWHRRKPTVIACLLAAFLFLLFLQTQVSHHRDEPPSVPAPQGVAEPDVDSTPVPVPASNPLLDRQIAFWRSLYHLIINNDPKCDHGPDVVMPQQLDIGFDPAHDHPRPDLLFMDPPDLKRMREAHSNFVSDLKRRTPKMAYEPGSRGIVMTGGFNQLPVLVISIRMLRRAHSSLPVEVFVANPAEWDEHICTVVLPTLNAKCLLFSEIFGAAETGVSIDRFQFKIMALIFSSFEEVLLLDSDAFPIHDPLPLFEQEPFRSTGLVVWPDFWYPSESPYYFEIAKIADIPPLNVRSSVESGEIIYSKAKHHLSLMLAAYYNYYGPSYYYPLLSQGAPGQGDKETFAWAAVALGEPFYAVHERVMALGRHDTSGNFLGSAMAQHDPIADHQLTETHGPPHERVKNTGSGTDNHYEIQAADVKPFFIHANFPKFDPSTIFGQPMTGFSGEVTGAGGPTRDTNGTNVRCWMDPVRAVELFGFDAERRFWEEIKTVACEYEHQFACWANKKGICERTTSYWNDVFGPDSRS